MDPVNRSTFFLSLAAKCRIPSRDRAARWHSAKDRHPSIQIGAILSDSSMVR